MSDHVVRGAERLEECVKAVARDPRATAFFCDIDGTISPLAPTPADAAVPRDFRAALATLAPRLGLLAFVSGREVGDGRDMITLRDAVYVGNHGLQVLYPSGQITVTPTALPYVDAVRAAALRAAALEPRLPGLFVENKQLVVAVHYREVADPDEARAIIDAHVVGPARADGLHISTGKFVIEVRPPIPVGKGTAIRDLLDAGGYATAIFIGDDLTDIDGLEAVREWAAAASAGVRLGCAAAVAGDETPAAVTAAADVWLDGTDAVLTLLTRLVDETRNHSPEL